MDSASILYLSVTRLDMHLYSTVHLAQAANLMVHKVVQLRKSSSAAGTHE